MQARRRSREFEIARIEVLESIAHNAPLPESVERIALAIEQRIGGSACIIAIPQEKSCSIGESVLIAPSLAEDIQAKILPVLACALRSEQCDEGDTGKGDNWLAAVLSATRRPGLDFTGSDQSLVRLWNGTVAGVVVLLFERQLDAEEAEIGNQNVVRWASRLVSLAIEHSCMHQRLLYQARHDDLTGLPNRAVAEDRLQQVLARAHRRKEVFAVLCIDLDGFKAINDEMGHETGDAVLRAVATRLRARTRHSDTLARVGGDEFWAIIEDCSREDSARVVAQALVAALEEPLSLDGRNLKISASIGIARYPSDGADAPQLKRNADQAMYRAKSLGGGQIFFSTPLNSDQETGREVASTKA